MKSNEFIIFYDWETGKVLRRIDIIPKKLYWNDTGSLVCLTTTDDFYILAYNKSLVSENINSITGIEGFEEAFDLVYEYHDTVNSGIWISNVFYYINNGGKINYSISGKVFNYANTDKKK